MRAVAASSFARRSFAKIESVCFAGSARGSNRPLHGAEAAGVPEFVAEVAALDDLLLVELDVLPLRRDAHEAEAQAVGARISR